MTADRLRERITDLLVHNLVDVIEQWVINNDTADLAAFLEEQLGFADVELEDLEAQADGLDLFRAPPRPDVFWRKWEALPDSELCLVCGQPDSCGDCNHERLSKEDVARLCE